MIKLFEGGDQTQETMSSLLIAEITGKRHDHVMRDCKKLSETLEKEGEPKFGLSYYRSEQNKELPMYVLTKEQTYLLVTGYSAPLRLKVIRRLEELENQAPKLPTTYKEALLALVEAEEQKELAMLQVSNLNIALDNLLDWVSIIKVSQFNNVKETIFKWRELKAKSEQMGYAIKKAESARYGYQNLYHVDVFRACYPQFNYDFKN
jgi:Rha family phage regulatory protein